MSILLWLLPALLVTCAACAWAAWVGRDHLAVSDQSQAARDRAQQRMGEALARPAPGQRAVRRREPSTGVALRRR